MFADFFHAIFMLNNFHCTYVYIIHPIIDACFVMLRYFVQESSSTDNEVSDEDYTPPVSKRKAYVPVKRTEPFSNSVVQLDPDMWKK